MIILEQTGIRWFLEEKDLTLILPNYAPANERRRGYAVLPYRSGKVFIKSFIEKGFFGYARNILNPRGKKEYITGKRLNEMGIETPKPLGYGIGKHRSYIIQQFLEGESVTSVLQKTQKQKGLPAAFNSHHELSTTTGRENKRADVIEGIVRLLIHLKSNHVVHNDLHLDNIIVSGGTLFLIDLHKTRIARLFRKKDEMRNLSHALSIGYKFLSDEEKETFFRLYGNLKVKIALERQLAAMHKLWIKRKKDRAFRSTSKITRLSGRIFFNNIIDFNDGGFVSLIKKDKKVRVERYSNHIRKIYLARRRLKKAWENHVALLYLGLDIIPRAYYVCLPGHHAPGYIAMEDLSHSGMELDRFTDGRYDKMTMQERHRFIHTLAVFFQAIFGAGIIHRDLKGCNLFVKGEGKFYLLDVEDIDFVQVDNEHIKRMLIQLNTTVPTRIRASERIRFYLKLKRFVTGDPKKLFREIVKESFLQDVVYEGAGGLKRERLGNHQA